MKLVLLFKTNRELLFNGQRENYLKTSFFSKNIRLIQSEAKLTNFLNTVHIFTGFLVRYTPIIDPSSPAEEVFIFPRNSIILHPQPP
jgi:hypothetical protein